MTRGMTWRRRRGMATVVALTLLAFVAVLLAALGTWIGLEARRTHAAGEDAQLRQLLHAGALAASDSSMSAGTSDLPLPRELSEQAARVTVVITQPSPSMRTATIEAGLATHRARQIVHYARSGERWTITSATLDPI
jgi:hypothetical protein